MRLYSPRGSIKLKILSYRTTINASLGSSITRSRLVHYPVTFSQRILNVDVQCSSQKESQRLHRFIQKHHEDVQENPDNTLRIVDSNRDINYRGVCTKGVDSRSVVDYAPLVQLSFLLTKDSLSSVTKDSSTGESWRKVYEDGYGSGDGSQTITPIRPM